MTVEITFTNKKQSLDLLTDIFNRWNYHLTRMTEDEVFTRAVHPTRSIKDDVAHVWFWQRLTVARTKAVVNNSTPNFDWWPHEIDRESAEDSVINEWIFKTYLQKPWSEVYKDWKEGFVQLITLTEQIDEKDLLDPKKFLWLKGYPLIVVLSGSYNHHRIHLEKILDTINDS